MYDNNPPYPHYDHLPYAKEPWKSIYVYQRLFTTLALVPIWIVYYSIAPKSIRPRASWNLRQVINVNFTRRIYKVTEVAGVTWGTRDPTVAADEKSLKETRFEWVKPLPEEFRTGIVKEGASFTEVGCYVWPKQVHPAIQKIRNLKNPPEDTQHLPSALDLEAGTDDVPIVGIFMHGGGYCHMSAHEKSRTSRIPRNLVKKNIMQEVYSVEYRLLQHSPFPAVVQDAAAVYAHVVEQYGIRKSKCKLILIGDSSGGNLVLTLTRWIRDESHLPLPHGLLLLSPSCDASHALPETLSSHIPRPNSRTDYLVDTPEPRALLQRTFLGFKHTGPYTPEEERRLMEVVHSEYVSPCSPIVLQRWGHETKQDPEGEFVGHVFERLPLTAPAVASTASTASRIPLLAGVVNDVNVDPIDLDSPYYKSRRFPKLFGDFPRTMVVCGDAERLVREIRSLIAAMETDGVDLTVHWAQDACHDPLLLSDFWWDRRVLAEIWRAVEAWSTSFEEGAGANKSAGPSSAGSSQDSGIAAAKDVKE